MKQIFVLFLLFVISIPAQAQSERDAIKGAAATASRGVGSRRPPPDTLTWRKGGDVSINFSQIHLSNWSAGGEKSISFSGSSNFYANYKKDKVIWDNYAFLAYGIIKAGERDPIKNSDQFNIGSRVGYQMANNWYYTLAMLGRTQLDKGYRYTAKDTIYNSDFLAPALLFLSLGLDYKPSSRFFVSFSPAMGKATFVASNNPIVLSTAGIQQELDEEGNLLNKAQKTRYEFGAGVVFNLNGNFFEKKETYNSQLELFSNYLDKPQNIDVIWDFQFRVALTKHVAAGLRLNMLYSDNQKTFVKNKDTGVMEQRGAQLQVKEFFEIGLFFAF